MDTRSQTMTLVQALAGFAGVALVLIGIGGTIYRMLAPGGWLAQSIGGSMSASGAATLALLTLGLVAWFTRTLPGCGRGALVPNLLGAGFALTGAWYVMQMVLRGA